MRNCAEVAGGKARTLYDDMKEQYGLGDLTEDQYRQ